MIDGEGLAATVGVPSGAADGVGVGTGLVPTLFLFVGPKLIQANAIATTAVAAINALPSVFMEMGLHGLRRTRSCRVVRIARRTPSTASGGVRSEPASSQSV